YAGGLGAFRCSYGIFRTLKAGKVVDVAHPGERKRKAKPRSEWVIKWGTHESILPRETWEKTQERLEGRAVLKANQHTLTPARRISPAALCENCQSPLTINGRTANGQASLRCNGY